MSAIQLPTVQIGPRESQAWLLGMRIPQVLLVGGALVAFSNLINGAGPLAAMAKRTDGQVSELLGVLSTVSWLFLIAALLAIAFIPFKGRYLDQYVPVTANFIAQKLTKQDVFRGGVFRMSATDTVPQIALPGDLAHLEFLAFDTGDGQEVCVVKDPKAKTYTAVLVVEGDTFALADTADQAARVEAFGQLQTRLSQSSNLISRIQVVERTDPDSGEGLVRDFRRRGLHNGSFQSAAYEELVRVVPSTQQAHETFVAVSLDARKAVSAIRRSGGGDMGASATLFVSWQPSRPTWRLPACAWRAGARLV